MKRLARMSAVMMALVSSAAVVLAGATVALNPGGSGPSGNYTDANGSIEMRKGANATWADGTGSMRAIDPTAEKKTDGDAVDNKECTGVIDEAINPMWQWGFTSSMTVSSGGYISASFKNKVEGGARGELAIWGDGGRVCAGAEVVTTNQNAPGNFDIEVDVDERKYTITDGGSYHRLDNPLGNGGGTRDIATGQSYTKWGAACRFIYESRVRGWLEIDFSAAGPERASFAMDQINGQWGGVVMAWDYDPLNGPILLGSWVLD